MATFEIEANGQTFEVDAPDEATALHALGLGPAPAPRSYSAGETALEGIKQLGIGFNNFYDSLNNIWRVPYEAITGEQLPRGSPLNPGGSFSRLPAEAAVPQTTLGRYANRAGEGLAASLPMMVGLYGAAPTLATLGEATLPRAIGSTIGRAIVANPAAAAGADVLATLTSTTAQQAAADAGMGPVGQTIAGLAGGFAPTAAMLPVTGARRVLETARASANPFAKFAAGLGDQTVEDVANAAAVGTTGQQLGINRRTLDLLGEELVRANGDQGTARAATLARLEGELADESAAAQTDLTDLNTQIATRGTPATQDEGRRIRRLTTLANRDPAATAADRFRRLLYVNEGSDLMLGEFPAVAQSNMATRLREPQNVTDEAAAATTNPGMQNQFDYIANTGTLASSQRVRNAIARRATTLPENAAANVQALAPGGQTIQDVEAMLGNLQRQASADYGRVYNQPGAVNYGLLHGLLNRIMERHLARVAGRAGDQADALRQALDRFYVANPRGVAGQQEALSQPGVVGARIAQPLLQDELAAARNTVREARRRAGEIEAEARSQGASAAELRDMRDAHQLAINDLSRNADAMAEQLRLTSRDVVPPAQRTLTPTMQAAQDARAGIRGQIQTARQAGRADIANILQPLYQDVTRAMERASPAWRTANRRWADLSLDRVGQELGDAFARQAGPQMRAQLRQFQQLAPAAQDIVRVHFVQRLLDDIQHAAQLGGDPNLMRAFSRADRRAMIREVLGDRAAVTMARLVRDANVMAKSRAMLGGSQTHIRGMTQAEQDRDINTMAAAANFDWRRWREEAFNRVVAMIRERRNRSMARIITTPMSDQMAVAEQIERMRRAAGRVYQATTTLRPQPYIPLPGVAGPALNPMLMGH